MVSRFLLLLLLAVTCVCGSLNCPKHPAPVLPSHGDLRLCDGGLLMIYMGPDGTNIEHMWGTVSGDEHNRTGAIAACHQLNFGGLIDMEHKMNPSLNSSTPVWMTNVQCSGNERHILRCKSSYGFNTTSSHEHDWHLDCFDKKYYSSEVDLIPPSNMTSLNISRSLGVVAIFTESQTDVQWFDYVQANIYNFSLNNSDTICRAMGFTHAVKNSVMTHDQFTKAYNYSFNLKSTTAINMDCSESFPCFGCCDSGKGVKANNELALILRCSFYRQSNMLDGGNNVVCEKDQDSKKMMDACQISGVEPKDGNLKKFTIITLLFSILLVIAIIQTIWNVKTCRRHCNGCNPEREPLLNER